MDKMIMVIMEILIDVLLCLLFDWVFDCCLTGIFVLEFCYEFKKTRDGKKFVQFGNQIDLVLT
jgi:hypothetical protein